MKLPERLVELFDYPVDAIAAAMPDLASPLWDANPHRQNKHIVHRQTRSIIFEWIDDGWLQGQKAVVTHFAYPLPELTKAAYACAEALNALYRGKVIRLMLTELVAHGKIARHADGGDGVVLVHRCHVPVETNPGVQFIIDEIPHYLRPGKAYEFDNTRRHSVVNESDRPRIHLMCDILPPALIV
jgi:Aspartyl/Asparaginyl beta-hydroxylase